MSKMKKKQGLVDKFLHPQADESEGSGERELDGNSETLSTDASEEPTTLPDEQALAGKNQHPKFDKFKRGN